MDGLARVLERAQALGLLGPGPVGAHIDHAQGFVDAWTTHRTAPPATVLDLGSGAGVPGLALSVAWPEATFALLDAAARRCAYLEWAVAELGIEGRATVLHGRAELLARDPQHDGAFDLVTARSFAPPAATAECAARFLAPAGALLVAEPPDEPSSAARWPAQGLEALGLGPARRAHAVSIVVIARTEACPARYPRRVGVPEKRPLF